MCEQCERKKEDDRLLWMTVRRALLMIAKAVETRYAERDVPKKAHRKAA